MLDARHFFIFQSSAKIKEILIKDKLILNRFYIMIFFNPAKFSKVYYVCTLKLQTIL